MEISQDVFFLGIFTKKIEETEVLLRYYPQLTPGTAVWVLNPQFEGVLSGGTSGEKEKEFGSRLISTSEPLIPSTMPDFATAEILLPYTLREGLYAWFRMQVDDVAAYDVRVIENVCPGTLCDGQSNLDDKCPCLSHPASTSNALQIKMTSKTVLGYMRNEEVKMVLQSRTLSKLFAKNGKELDLSEIDTFDLEDNVEEIFKKYLGNKIEIIGWLRSPKITDGIADTKILHVVKIEFIADMPQEGKDKLM